MMKRTADKLLLNRIHNSGPIIVAPVAVSNVAITGPDGNGYSTITKNAGAGAYDAEATSAPITGPFRLWWELPALPLQGAVNVGMAVLASGRALATVDRNVYVDNGGNFIPIELGANGPVTAIAAPNFILLERDAANTVKVYVGGDGGSNLGTLRHTYTNISSTLYLSILIFGVNDYAKIKLLDM